MKKIVIPPQSKEEIEKIRNEFDRDTISKYNKKDKIQKLRIKSFIQEGEELLEDYRKL
jgi:hypothetical protein